MVTENQANTAASHSELLADNSQQFNSGSRTIQQRKKLRKRALKIVNYYTLLSSGAGMIPNPFFIKSLWGDYWEKCFMI
jgi:hypothetical protein